MRERTGNGKRHHRSPMPTLMSGITETEVTSFGQVLSASVRHHSRAQPPSSASISSRIWRTLQPYTARKTSEGIVRCRFLSLPASLRYTDSADALLRYLRGARATVAVCTTHVLMRRLPRTLSPSAQLLARRAAYCSERTMGEVECSTWAGPAAYTANRNVHRVGRAVRSTLAATGSVQR